MTIKAYTISILNLYEANGGQVHPDITLSVLQFIEQNPSLREEYNVMLKQHKDALNQNIGKNIRAHYHLCNDKKGISVNPDQCSLITKYTRFKKQKKG